MVDAATLKESMEKEGVSRAVLCGFPFRDGGLIRLANDYVLEEAKREDRLTPLAVVDAEDGGAAEAEAERCLALGAQGIGEIAFYRGAPKKDGLDRLEGVARQAERAGKPLLLHVNEQVGHDYAGKAPMDLAGVVRFVEKHPGLTAILAHLGGGICFYEFMPEIRKALSRVYYDTAAVPYLYSKEVYGFVEAHLSEKTLFGSDYPLLRPNRYMKDLLGMGEAARERVMYGNARAIFGG